MKTVQFIFQIDNNTNRLINLFNSGKFESMDYGELSWKIGQLSEYQFLHLCNQVILNIKIDKETIQLFFPFVYEIDFDEIPENKESLLTHVEINYNHYCVMNIVNNTYFHPEEGIIELLTLEKKISYELQHIKRDFSKKLNLLESTHRLEEKTYVQDVINDSSETLNGSKLTGAFGENESIFKIIGHSIFQANFIDHMIWDKIEKLVKEVTKLNFSYEESTLNYKFQIIYPIAYSLNDWKSLVMREMIACKNQDKFLETKNFFLECLLKYKELTDQTYIHHKFDHHLEERYETSLSRSYSEVNKMVEWLETTFISPDKIEVNEQFKFIDEVNEKMKLTISNDFSQRKFLDLFDKYLSLNKIEYD